MDLKAKLCASFHSHHAVDAFPATCLPCRTACRVCHQCLTAAVCPGVAPGTEGFVKKAIKEADARYLDLRERGVSLIPIVFGADKENPEDVDQKIRALKKEFQKQAAAEKGFAPSGGGAKEASSSGNDGSSAVMGGLVKEVGSGDQLWYNLGSMPFLF